MVNSYVFFLVKTKTNNHFSYLFSSDLKGHTCKFPTRNLFFAKKPFIDLFDLSPQKVDKNWATKKKGPWLFGLFFGDEILPSCIGSIINHKDPVINQLIWGIFFFKFPFFKIVETSWGIYFSPPLIWGIWRIFLLFHLLEIYIFSNGKSEANTIRTLQWWFVWRWCIRTSPKKTHPKSNLFVKRCIASWWFQPIWKILVN